MTIKSFTNVSFIDLESNSTLQKKKHTIYSTHINFRSYLYNIEMDDVRTEETEGICTHNSMLSAFPTDVQH